MLLNFPNFQNYNIRISDLGRGDKQTFEVAKLRNLRERDFLRGSGRFVKDRRLIYEKTRWRFENFRAPL